MMFKYLWNFSKAYLDVLFSKGILDVIVPLDFLLKEYLVVIDSLDFCPKAYLVIISL